MSFHPSFRPPPSDPGGATLLMLHRHAIEVARAGALAMQGKINAVLEFTCTAGAASTVLRDPRLAIGSFLAFDPLTANAAAELAAGTIYTLAANRNSLVWTVTHANAGTTDRTFRVLVIG